MGETKPNGVDEAPPVVATDPEPVLRVRGDELIFTVDGRSTRVRLGAILDQAQQAPVLLLLYAAVLKLHDIDASMRLSLEMARGQIAQAVRSQTERTSPISPTFVADVFRQLREQGLVPPEPGSDAT